MIECHSRLHIAFVKDSPSRRFCYHFWVLSRFIFLYILCPEHTCEVGAVSSTSSRPNAFLVLKKNNVCNLNHWTSSLTKDYSKQRLIKFENSGFAEHSSPLECRFNNLTCYDKEKRRRQTGFYLFPSSNIESSADEESTGIGSAKSTNDDSDLSILSAPTEISNSLSGTQFVNDQQAALRHSDSRSQSDKNRKGMTTTRSGALDPSDRETSRTPSSSMLNSIQWDVYVCESKQSKERGSGATMGAFLGLAPSHLVSVKPAVISKPRGKGPNVRCIERRVYASSMTGRLITKAKPKAFEVNNVDSIDKVYRILTTHMDLSDDVDVRALKCLKYNYQGNAHLDKGEITQAIKAYDKALSTGYRDQEGVLLVMRATAYLQRAFRHRRALKAAVQSLKESVEWTTDENKDSESSKIFTPEWKMNILLHTAKNNPTLAPMLLNRLVKQSNLQSQKFQQTKFRHGLYEYALLHATQDSLRSTQLLPRYAKTWLRAGDSLAELRKLKEATYYYEKALELDPTLGSTLVPTIARLRDAQMAMDAAATTAILDKSKFLQ